MTRIVTTTYRYKRPPRKKKPIVLTGSAIVRSGHREEVSTPPTHPAPANDDRKSAIVTVTDKKHVAKAGRLVTVARGSEVAPSPTGSSRSEPAPVAPANEARKSAIVTARRPGARSSAYVPDMTDEEHRRRGDAAGALFREIVRRATE